jgi:NAD(P) transhydrogenase subunit beta
MTSTFILDLIYLIGSVTFILGLKMLSNPEKARTGNLIAAAGMTLAIIATIIFVPIIKGISISPTIYGLLAGGIVIGTVIGWMVAKKVKMTAMPQLVSLFNGMGGACAALISLIEFGHALEHGSLKILITIMAGLIIGSVSFSGSMIAFLKLNGNLGKDIRLPMYNLINNIILLATVGFAGYLVFMSTGPAPMTEWPHLLMFSFVALALALFYGIMFVLPIGGADMPVVISLLNSFTGLAAAAGGFLYHNQVMLTGGILVGSAGTLLTVAMCEGMNRSLFSVIFGAFGGGGATAAVAGATGGSIKDISVADTAVLMNYSKKVVIVPGYGLAVAQAQHVMHELEVLLEERGVEVKYAIHPVAGRMPGHMNVLMAEWKTLTPNLKLLTWYLSWALTTWLTLPLKPTLPPLSMVCLYWK